MQKGNVNGALRLTLQMLSLKHPEAQQPNVEVMLKDQKRQITVLFMKTSMKMQ